MKAEEIVRKYSYISESDWKSKVVDDEIVIQLMKSFAHYHVKQAVEEIKLQSQLNFVPFDEEAWSQSNIERQDILDFYSDGESDIDFQYEQLRKRDGFLIEIDHDSIENAYPLENIV